MAGQANDSLDLTYDDVDPSLEYNCRLYLFIVYTLILGPIIVVGFIGNSLTFVVFWKGNFNSSTTFLFLSLSLVDSAHLLTVFPFATVMAFVEYTGCLQDYLTLRPYFTVYLFPAILLTKTAAIWVVVLVAINRYIIVCLPLRATQWCTLTKVKIELAVVLIAAVLYNIPKFAENRVSLDMTYVEYTSFGENGLFFFIYDTICLLIFLLALPIVTLTVVTVRLIKAIKAHRRMQLAMQNRSQQNDSNVTFSLVIVVIVFIACQVPTFVWYVLYAVLEYEANDCGGFLFYAGRIVSILITLNSSINFVIYIIANKAFRDVLMEKVCGRRTQIPVVTAHEMVGPERVTDADLSTTVTQASVDTASEMDGTGRVTDADLSTTVTQASVDTASEMVGTERVTDADRSTTVTQASVDTASEMDGTERVTDADLSTTVTQASVDTASEMVGTERVTDADRSTTVTQASVDTASEMDGTERVTDADLSTTVTQASVDTASEMGGTERVTDADRSTTVTQASVDTASEMVGTERVTDADLSTTVTQASVDTASEMDGTGRVTDADRSTTVTQASVDTASEMDGTGRVTDADRSTTVTQASVDTASEMVGTERVRTGQRQ